MFRSFISCLIALASLFGCVGRVKPVENAETIKYLDLRAHSREIRLTDLAENIRYLPLETTDECLISYIRRITGDLDLIFVQNNDEDLYVFDAKGKFRNRIGHKGRGPGEYVQLYSFFLDRANREVGILDTYASKVIFYNYLGEMLRETALPDTIRYIAMAEMAVDGRLLVGNRLGGTGRRFVENGHPQFSMLEYDRENNRLDYVQGFLDQFLLEGVWTGSPVESMISYSPERLLFAGHFSNVIYQYRKGEFSTAYVLETDKQIASQKYFDRHVGKYEYPDYIMDILRQDDIFWGMGICEDEQYMIMRITGQTVLYDKNSGKGVFLSLIQGNLDNSYVILPERILGKEWVDIRTLHGKNLQKLVGSLSDSDNPVLELITFREDAVKRLYEKYGTEE